MRLKIKTYKNPNFRINEIVTNHKLINFRAKIINIYEDSNLQEIIQQYNKNPIFKWESSEIKDWIKNLAKINIVYLIELQDIFRQNTFINESNISKLIP